MISVHTPAPTVLPPSLMAKRSSFSRAMGETSSMVNGYIVTGHDHLHPFRKLRYPGYVRCSDVELGTIAGEEGGMPSTLFLG